MQVFKTPNDFLKSFRVFSVLYLQKKFKGTWKISEVMTVFLLHYVVFTQFFSGFTPQIGKDCFLAENATIVGDTVIGDGCSIWFNAVLRGDVNWIKIGNHVNIQDGSVLHTLYEKSTITIGDYVSVGHNVTIHGADVHDYALIGMGSTLLDGVVVGEGAIVAAGSLVLKNTQIGPYEVWGGVPAKFIKKADPEQTNEINRKIAHNYAMYASWYMEEE